MIGLCCDFLFFAFSVFLLDSLFSSLDAVWSSNVKKVLNNYFLKHQCSYFNFLALTEKEAWKDDTQGSIGSGKTARPGELLFKFSGSGSKTILLTSKAAEVVVWFHLYNNMNLPVATK